MNAASPKDKNWTIREILTWTQLRFQQAQISTPLLDAQLLLCHILNVKKINLYLDFDKPLTPFERSCMRDFVKRRLAGEPVAYILNEKYWYDLKFYVDQRVLIPRPETECLIDLVLEVFNNTKAHPKVIFDFCTGSGCLAIALAKLFPNAKVVGVDISDQALEVARKNANLHSVNNIDWLQLNLENSESYEYLKKQYNAAQIIVANPPYVSHHEWENLENSVKNFEPKLALVAQEDGLKIGKLIKINIEKYNLMDYNISVFGMELGVNHPIYLCENTNLPILKNSSFLKFNLIHNWFSMNDLDSKNRFLCKIVQELD